MAILAKQILKTSGFKKAQVNDTVSWVISQLKSSHEAVFVFDGKKFAGLITLYHSFLKKRPIASEKVSRVLYLPPKIFLRTPLEEIGRLMIESRVYQLPVFEQNGEFKGMVSYRSLLRHMKNLPEMQNQVKDVFLLHQPIFIFLKDDIDKARHLMLDKKTSRLVVLDREGKTIGILSSFDLRRLATSPIDSIRPFSLTPDKVSLGSRKVEEFYHPGLVSVLANQPANLVLKNILEEDVGSVLIFNHPQDKVPAGILSVRDILKYFVQSGKNITPQKLVFSLRVPMKDYEKNFIFDRFASLFETNRIFRDKIQKIELDFAPERKRSLGGPLFRIKALVTTKENNFFTVSGYGKKISLAATELVQRIKNVISRKEEK
jgi:CBS domain-containing protein